MILLTFKNLLSGFRLGTFLKLYELRVGSVGSGLLISARFQVGKLQETMSEKPLYLEMLALIGMHHLRPEPITPPPLKSFRLLFNYPNSYFEPALRLPGKYKSWPELIEASVNRKLSQQIYNADQE